MNIFRRTAIVVAAILVLGLGVFALVRTSGPVAGDIIIIKGGSLEVICPKGDACLGVADATGKYKHKTATSHITKIQVKSASGEVLYSGEFTGGTQPQIEITYK